MDTKSTQLTFEEFKSLAKSHNLIPLYRTLSADLETPVSAFLKLRTGDYDFLFESVVGGEKWARYSFLGSQPRKVFTFDDGVFEILDCREHKKTHHKEENDPLDYLRQQMKPFIPYQDPKLPRFFGGLVGYIGYDMVRYFEKVSIKPKKTSLPDMSFLLADSLIIFDNLYQVMRLVRVVIIPDDAKTDDVKLQHIYDAAIRSIDAMESRLGEDLIIPESHGGQDPIQEEQSLNQDEFQQIVESAKEYIEAGDIFQVVLSIQFKLHIKDLEPIELYRAIRRINPSPYMYYLGFGDKAIVGASPEVLVRVEEGKIDVRPIAGTRKRGATEAEDLEMEEDLCNDPKERAEHIMLVDLGRNDIGRVAKVGSVHVNDKEVVERYSHVMHLVSHVSGELDDEHDVFDAIQATFPAGTLSGAPKIRAMQIIDELEPVGRGVYGGAIGYISFTQNADLAITIRTAVVDPDEVVVQAGAGVVYNSIPELEYKECCNKARAMMTAIDESVRT